MSNRICTFDELKSFIKKGIESRTFKQLMPPVFLIITTLFFSVATKGRFFTSTNLKIIFNQALIVGTVATAATFIFATGNISLSMGATTVLTATIVGFVYNATESIALMIFTAIFVGVLLMLISVYLSTTLKVQVMYVTIVMMILLSAIQKSILKGNSVAFPYELTSMLNNMYFSYIVFGVYFVLSLVLFHFSRIGRTLRMIGTNKTCAGQTGLEINKSLVIAFFLAGIGCGAGALLAIVRSGSIGSSTLSSLNMDGMLALVLGGMSIFGGSRSYSYSGVIGSLTVCVLNQGLLMMNVDSTIIQGVRGILFLVLVCGAQKRPKGLPAAEHGAEA